MRADIIFHWIYIDQLRSTNISILWGEVPFPDMFEFVPTSKSRFEVPSSVAKQPSVGGDIVIPANDGDGVQDDVGVEQANETYEEDSCWSMINKMLRW